MLDATSPTTRLVLPARLVLKSMAQGHQIAHQAGYYLLHGRWHKMSQGKPAPKGAPVAAHPHAAGEHAPAKHFTDDQWAQLKLPESNVNAGTYNKQLEQLKQHSEAGHVTGILGSGFGVNTYGTKLSKIANHLLKLHGSEHTVTPGQKAGEHAAVKQAPATKQEAVASAVAHLEHDQTEKDIPASEKKDDAAAVQAIKEAPSTDAALATAKEHMAEDVAAKVGDAAEHKEDKAELGKLEGAAAAADTSPKNGDTKQGADGTLTFKDGRWHKEAEAAAATDLDTLAQDIQDKADVMDHHGALQAASAYAVKHKGADWAWSDAKDALQAAGLSDMAQALMHIQKQPGSVGNQAATAKPSITMPTFQEGKTVTGVVKYYEKVAQQVLDMAAKGDAAGLEQLKTKGMQPNAKTGKVSNTWAAKTPNSKMLLALHAQAVAAAAGKPEPQAAAPAPEPAAEAPAAPEPTPATGPITADQLGKLQSIPWHKLKLPDTNSNAASVNKKLKALEDAAFAGDVAAIEAMTWGKNTYNKKLELAAKTAVAALKEGGAAAAAPEAAQAPSTAAEPEAKAHEVSLSDFKTGAMVPTLSKKAFQGDNQVWYSQQKPSDTVFEAGSTFAGEGAHPHTIKMAGQIKAASAAGYKVTYYKTAGLQAVYVFEKDGKLLTKEGAQALADGGAAADAPIKPVVVNLPGYGSYTKQTDGAWKSPSAGTAMVGSYQWALIQLVSGGGLEGQKVNAGMKMDVVLEAVKNGVSPTKALNEVYAPGSENGPKEGDTKVINGVTYQLINGRWHKVTPGQAAAPQAAAAAPEPAPAQHKGLTPAQAIKLGKGLKTSSGMKDILKKMAVAADVDGLNKFIVDHPNLPASKHLAKKLIEAIVGGHGLGAAPGEAKPKAPPKAKPAPTQQATPFTPGAPEAMDSWVQTGGQGGSNPGGKFKDPSGQEWYCKFPQDEDTAKSEVLAAKLYSLAGLASQDAKLITKGGKVGIASKWVEVVKGSPAKLAATADAQSGFAVDAWLGNWDVVGMGYDNLQIGADGKAVRVDAGGSLEYRAQGAKKPFGNKVDEIETLRDKVKNPQAAAIFGGMTEADITASVAKVLKISDVAIRAMVNQFGPGDAAAKAKLADTLIARKKDLAAKYPAAAKASKKHVFDPAKISAPPSFMNWGGSGKSGPSSKEFVNQSNEDAVQKIFAAAKTGDMDAVKNLDLPVYNKDTGQQSGQAKALEHPSQHVKGYAQQAINEINYQLNPPKRFRFDGGHPLAALHNAYPSHAGPPASQAVQKLGKFLMLGEPGTVKYDDLALPPKITHTEGGGTLTIGTYAAAAKAAFSKMPATQKQAIQSYTGSGYHEINSSLWSGNESGAAKAAGEALKTLGHDIAPGTVLSRKISLHGAELDMLLKSAGKVLQEPAVMSTSIRPSSWSGNVHLKLHVGPGVKGLWVGQGSNPGGGAVSKHAGEDEMILPPGTRLLILGAKKGADSDGFGKGGSHVIEAVILPTM